MFKNPMTYAKKIVPIFSLFLFFFHKNIIILENIQICISINVIIFSVLFDKKLKIMFKNPTTYARKIVPIFSLFLFFFHKIIFLKISKLAFD